MNLKNVLKSVDYKGLALQHCEKAVIVVVTALLAMFMISGVKKAMTASTVTPQRIDQLADGLNKSITSSQWNESVAKQEQVENPDFKGLIAELMNGIRPDQFALGQQYFKFVDYGNVLRKKPDILSPYNSLAIADKGSLLVYKLDPKTGEFIEKDPPVRAVVKKKQEDEPTKKKAQPKAPPKSPSRAGGMAMSGGGGSGGGDMSMGEYMGGRGGGGAGRMGGLSGMGMGGMGGGGVGAGAGAGAMSSDDGGSRMGGNIGAANQRRSASAIRRSASRNSDDAMYDDIDEQNQKNNSATPTEKGKTPPRKKIREEEVKGIRWALITALFPHREQVNKFIEALHTPDDPPNYEYVMVERREVLSDGSLSEWAKIDADKIKDLQKRMPERWVPEEPTVHSAKADFPGLLMRLPELEVGSWAKLFRREAVKSAAEATGNTQVAQSGGRRGGGDSGDDQGSLFNSNQGGAVTGEGASSSGGGPGAALSGAGMEGMGRGAGAQRPPGMGNMNSGMNEQMRGGGMTGNMMDRRMGGGGAGGNAPNRSSGSPAATPKVVQKTKAEIVQIRFVDYTVEPEHTYQYRLKVVVTNPNYNRLDVMNQEENAKEKKLSSDEWSEPTPLVYVPGDVEYYVLDRVKLREEAKLQVHQWISEVGDWQYADFQIKPGDPIGRKVPDYPLVGWDDPPKVKKTELDFSTQDLLLNVTGGDKGFMFEVDGAEYKFTERLPTEIFVIDRLGDLAVRNDDFDKNNFDRVERVKYIKEVLDKARATEDKDKEKDKKKPESGSRDDFDGRSAPSRKDGSEK